MVGWAGATVLLAAVESAQAADTDVLAEVDVTGDGCGADVEPIGSEIVKTLAGWDSEPLNGA